MDGVLTPLGVEALIRKFAPAYEAVDVMSAAGERAPTILVVEDNEDDLFLFQFAVKRGSYGATFHYVRDGQEAISYMKGEAPFEDRKAHPFPDVVILDLELPKIDGFQVLDWIRATPGCKELRVFALTGWEPGPHAGRAKAAGADRVLFKGAGIEPMEAALREILAL